MTNRITARLFDNGTEEGMGGCACCVALALVEKGEGDVRGMD